MDNLEMEQLLKKIDSTNAKNSILSLHRRISDMMVLQGRSLAVINQSRNNVKSIHDVEFKVFSQFGEDGIIQHIINEVNITKDEEIFIEFGVENYLEANTRFLLINNNWKGLVMDGSENNVNFIKSQDFYWRNDLTAINAWIDRDNINSLIEDAGFSGNIGLLSIDVDGNDYWIWDAINVVNPVIVAVEWNSVFGNEQAVTIPYDPMFYRTDAHHSNLYYGASIAALEHLGKKKGYSLIGSNSAGNNLFFVRNDRLGKLKSLTAKEAYVESRIRESRDENGNLNFLSSKAKLLAIKDQMIVSVTNDKISAISEIIM